MYVMNEFKSGENVVEVTRNQTTDIISLFVKDNKPIELNEEEESPRSTWRLRRRR